MGAELGARPDDEVITTVADDDAARPVVEALLLAGLGPSLRPVPEGLAVCVVAGDGPRARRALGLAEPTVDPVGPSAPRRAPGARRASSATGGSGAPPRATGAPAGPAPAPATSADGFRAGLRGLGGSTVWRTVLLCLVLLVIVPAIAFWISFKAAGG